MKLHYSPTSPFVRKVLIAAHELGLADRIEQVRARASPDQLNQTLNRDNPLGKVPTLITDDGQALYDSRVICEYLDSLHGGAQLFPVATPARFQVLARQALADGIMDAAVLLRYETFLRPEAARWDEWIAGQTGKFERGLDRLDSEADRLGDSIDIGTIAVACALGYLDLRYTDLAWRDGRPQLSAWMERFAARPSYRATSPE
ncbi:MAG: glutathione S-transferase [Myxococcota bacterium]